MVRFTASGAQDSKIQPNHQVQMFLRCDVAATIALARAGRRSMTPRSTTREGQRSRVTTYPADRFSRRVARDVSRGTTSGSTRGVSSRRTRCPDQRPSARVLGRLPITCPAQDGAYTYERGPSVFAVQWRCGKSRGGLQSGGDCVAAVGFRGPMKSAEGNRDEDCKQRPFLSVIVHTDSGVTFPFAEN